MIISYFSNNYKPGAAVIFFAVIFFAVVFSADVIYKQQSRRQDPAAFSIMR